MISYAQISNKGNREYNEDHVELCKKMNRYVFGLADGLGGHGHGDVASALAMKALKEQEEEAGLRESLADCFEIAQKKVEKEKKNRPECAGMMTTLTVLELRKAQVGWGHIGDSRIYYFQNGKLISHTLDQSVPQMLVNMKEIQESEIRHHPDRNRLLCSIGMEWENKPYRIDEVIRREGKQQFLLCSDGFWEYIEEKDMEQLLHKSLTPRQWLKRMEKLVRLNGKGYEMDNYSAVAVWSSTIQRK